MRNFRGGLRNFPEGWGIFGGGVEKFSGGGVEKFSGGGVEKFQGGGGYYYFGGGERG